MCRKDRRVWWGATAAHATKELQLYRHQGTYIYIATKEPATIFPPRNLQLRLGQKCGHLCLLGQKCGNLCLLRGKVCSSPFSGESSVFTLSPSSITTKQPTTILPPRNLQQYCVHLCFLRGKIVVICIFWSKSVVISAFWDEGEIICFCWELKCGHLHFLENLQLYCHH